MLGSLMREPVFWPARLIWLLKVESVVDDAMRLPVMVFMPEEPMVFTPDEPVEVMPDELRGFMPEEPIVFVSEVIW